MVRRGRAPVVCPAPLRRRLRRGARRRPAGTRGRWRRRCSQTALPAVAVSHVARWLSRARPRGGAPRLGRLPACARGPRCAGGPAARSRVRPLRSGR
eukprot:scaffold11843_cov72-Phaeocystis_antarctica.AAC.1